MGYLSQKKKNNRENLFLRVMLFLLSLFTFCVLMLNVGWIKGASFHLYVLCFVICVYSLFIARFGASILFLALVIINYFHVASASPIFFDQKFDTKHSFSHVYTPYKLPETDGEQEMILRQGHLVLGKDNVAPFITIAKQGCEFTIVHVYMKELLSEEKKTSLIKLKNFVLNQDEAVIMIGDFGFSPWEKELKIFLEKTGLEIKNRLLFSYDRGKFGFLQKPSFFVLGFRNVSLENMMIEKTNDGVAEPSIKVELGFY